MAPSISEQCRDCIKSLQRVISMSSQPDYGDDLIKTKEVNDDLDRLSLFIGDIGALHDPESPMSVESRLSEAKDVLTHISGLLGDLNEAAEDLLGIVSAEAQGLPYAIEHGREERTQNDSGIYELQNEIKGTITRLLRATTLIRQATTSDMFAKALNRKRCHIDSQFDITHVGEKYRKLATDDRIWLRQRLGRAITHRRQVLSYNRDHHEELEGDRSNRREEPQVSTTDQQLSNPTLFTKATTFISGRIDPSRLHAGEPDSEDDALSYTTMSRSVDGNGEASTSLRIPKLADLRIGNSSEFLCPFCFRIQRCKNDRLWKAHVFSDIRPYVCTFPNCDAPYYGDINAWFQHEVSSHRVAYECFICSDATIYSERTYVAHLKERHARIFDNAEGELQMRLAQKPLTEIPATDCPCCTEWVDRLKEQAVIAGKPILNRTLTVSPTVFKRHLAEHLEQLALFALPIIAETDASDESNDAIELKSGVNYESSVDVDNPVRIDHIANPNWKQGQLCWQAKGKCAEDYKSRETELLEELYQSRRESFSEVAISLFMIGKTPQKAKPMIIISSEDKRSREEAKRAIIQSGVLKNLNYEIGLLNYLPSGPIHPV
ncbi:unnamed protein product [Alternaria alternata]